MERTFTDQMGREVRLSGFPQRIVSLVPSQTELLYDLGLEKEVAGITRFCIHPDKWFREKTRVGGTKQIDFEKIAALQPDLVIGNKEENEREQIEMLMQHYPVWMSDIETLEDAYEMMVQLGTITGTQEKAKQLTDAIRKRFETFASKKKTKKSCLYFIWQKPYMCAGRDTFIDHLLETCGFDNLARKFPGRYPELTPDEIKTLSPEVTLLSSEPYPFGEKHVPEFCSLLPASQIIPVDGELFSWYGSRLQFAPGYFETLVAGNG